MKLWSLSLVLGVSLAFASPVFAQRERHGGIEIGAKGIKAVHLGLAWFPGAAFLPPKDKKKTINTTLADVVKRGDKIHFKQAAIDETVEAVAEMFEWLRKEGLPADRIHIVASSGVPRAENFGKLVEGIRAKTKKDTLDHLSVFQETSLTIRGAIPKERYGSAIMVDIGSGNIKLGYLEPNMGTSPGWFSVVRNPEVPGTVAYFKAIEKDVAEKTKAGTKTDFCRSAAAMRKEKICEPIEDEVTRRPLLYNSQYAYFGGGIVWAMMTIMKPGEVETEFVRFTVADILAFNRKVCVNPRAFPNVEVGGLPGKKPELAKKELDTVKRVFTPEQLVAGSEILKGVAESLRLGEKSGGKEREMYFVRSAQHCWILGYARLKAEKTK